MFKNNKRIPYNVLFAFCPNCVYLDKNQKLDCRYVCDKFQLNNGICSTCQFEILNEIKKRGRPKNVK